MHFQNPCQTSLSKIIFNARVVELLKQPTEEVDSWTLIIEMIKKKKVCTLDILECRRPDHTIPISHVCHKNHTK